MIEQRLQDVMRRCLAPTTRPQLFKNMISWPLFNLTFMRSQKSRMLPSASEILKCVYTSNHICLPRMRFPSRANCPLMLIIALIISADNTAESAEASLAPKEGGAPLSFCFARVAPGASVSMMQATPK